MLHDLPVLALYDAGMMTLQRARGHLAAAMVVAVGALVAARGTDTTQLAEPFKGITRDGTAVRGLFPDSRHRRLDGRTCRRQRPRFSTR